MGFVVGFLYDFRAFGIEGEKIVRRFLGDDTSLDTLEGSAKPVYIYIFVYWH